MNNLSSYCGLVEAKIRASDKDLPVQIQNIITNLKRASQIYIGTGKSLSEALIFASTN